MSRCKNAVRVISGKGRSINLAKEPLIKPTFSVPPPSANKIKVCTPQQIRSICPPEPCVCPEPPPPPTCAQKTREASIFVLKLLIVLAVFAGSCCAGIWDDKKAIELSDRVKNKIKDALGMEENNESGEYYGLTYNLSTMWNNAINKIFYVITVVPVIMVKKLLTKRSPPEDDSKNEPPVPKTTSYDIIQWIIR